MGVQEPYREYKADMQRTKVSTSSSASRLVSVPKALWKAHRSKSQARVAAGSQRECSWIPEGNCQWRAASGHRLTLLPTNLIALTEVERTVLQQLALAQLQAKNLGCRIEIPKEDASTPCNKKAKRRPALLRKRAVTTSYLEGNNEKDIPSDGPVFGIPLSQCIDNDRLNRQRVPSLLRERRPEPVSSLSGISSQSAEDLSWVGRSESLSDTSLASTGDTQDEQMQEYRLGELLHLRKPSALELERLERNQGSSDGWDPALFERSPRVPFVVNSCFKHIENYGLHTLGIFRVSTSKKRIRQLREDFDSGKDIKLNEEHHPHDVAQLLKEFFRDMPEPLLTRPLYQPFLTSLRIPNPIQRLEVLKLLVRLLPFPNCDTLWALTNFLAKVSENAIDTISKAGEKLPGNKMDPHNLATLFGPNLLRVTRTGKDAEFLVETAKRAEERCDVILVVRSLIENHDKLFEVLPEEMDAVYRKLLVDDAATLDVLLRHRFYTILQSQIRTTNPEEFCNSEQALIMSMEEQCTGQREFRDSFGINRRVPSISISPDTSYMHGSADDKSSVDSDEYLLVMTSAKGHERLSVQDLSLLGRRQSSVSSIEFSCDSSSSSKLTPGKESHLLMPVMDNGRHSSKGDVDKGSSKSFKVEKSASTSMLYNVFMGKPKKEKKKQEAAAVAKSKSSSKSGELQSSQQNLFVLSKSKSTIDQRGSVCSQPSSCSGTPPMGSILVTGERSRSRSRQQSSVHFPQERWKRREIIASEYIEKS